MAEEPFPFEEETESGVRPGKIRCPIDEGLIWRIPEGQSDLWIPAFTVGDMRSVLGWLIGAWPFVTSPWGVADNDRELLITE